MNAPGISAPQLSESSEFWKYWLGQTISSFGGAFTGFVLPLLIFKLTGSAMTLAFGMAASIVPYLLFGLVLGAWVDRTNRKRLMIVADLARAGVVLLVPLLSMLGMLSVGWIYAVIVLNATLSICFDAASFAALPHLVPRDALVTANGRLQASLSLAGTLAPLAAGLLLSLVALPLLLVVDALSFLVSAISLMLIGMAFNDAEQRPPTRVRDDIAEGLRYVAKHPLLRWMTLLIVLVNFAASTVSAQVVLFAKEVLATTDTQTGVLFAAGGAGVILTSLLASPLRRWVPFNFVALGSLMLFGTLAVAFAFNRWFWLALPLWAGMTGMGNLFNINIISLAQSFIPDTLLGRVSSFMRMLTWSSVPAGVLLGGVAIERTGNVALIYGVLGAAIALLPLLFIRTPLARGNDQDAPPEPPPRNSR